MLLNHSIIHDTIIVITGLSFGSMHPIPDHRHQEGHGLLHWRHCRHRWLNTVPEVHGGGLNARHRRSIHGGLNARHRGSIHGVSQHDVSVQCTGYAAHASIHPGVASIHPGVASRTYSQSWWAETDLAAKAARTSLACENNDWKNDCKTVVRGHIWWKWKWRLERGHVRWKQRLGSYVWSLTRVAVIEVNLQNCQMSHTSRGRGIESDTPSGWRFGKVTCFCGVTFVASLVCFCAFSAAPPECRRWSERTESACVWRWGMRGWRCERWSRFYMLCVCVCACVCMIAHV